MQFSQIPGSEELKQHLVTSFWRGKVAHAQLFSGKMGSSVFPMAMAYGTYLMCENKTENDSCGKCSNCVRIQKFIHPDIHYFFPKISATDSGKYEKVLSEALPKFRTFMMDQPFGNLKNWSEVYGQENKNLLIGKEDSRYLLKNISMRSVEGGFKIVFFWYTELMNASSANAILKILEEPPDKTIFILVSYNYDRLLATITSRAQLVVVPPNQPDEIESYLLETGVEGAHAKHASVLAEGSVGAALELVKKENNLEYRLFQQWMLECWNKDLISLTKRSEDFSKAGKAAQKGNMEYSLFLVRNAVIHASGNKSYIQKEEVQSFISKYSDRLGIQKLEKIYTIINEAMIHLEYNSNARITHLNLSLEIIKVLSS